MILRWRHVTALFVAPLLLATACSSTLADTGADESEGELNYRSTDGQEFLMTTEVNFKIRDDIQALQGSAKDDAIRVVADSQRTSTALAIAAELDRVFPESERMSRGGVAVQLRQMTAGLSDLKTNDNGATYTMTVNAEFSGSTGFDKKLPLTTANGKTFLPVPNSDSTGAPLQVFITPEDRSPNAYPKYLDLFEDGLDISIHEGDDHDVPRQDLDHAKSIYTDLVSLGFKSPVASFEDLKIDSGPLVGSIKVKGKDVAVRVRIYHVNMSTPQTRDTLINAYKDSVKNADVIIYDGHAGRQLDYSGIVVAYNPDRAALPATEFKKLETTDKQQVYLFNGCETYTGYADSLYANPKRNTVNTDIITTGNFSVIRKSADQVLAFLHGFIEQKSNAWIPRSWDSVLSRMNAAGDASWVHIYGVHGIDDDPKASPTANDSYIGNACTQDSDCGAPDSKCVVGSIPNRKVCGVACADSPGCPNNLRCVAPTGSKAPADDQQCIQ